MANQSGGKGARRECDESIERGKERVRERMRRRAGATDAAVDASDGCRSTTLRALKCCGRLRRLESMAAADAEEVVADHAGQPGRAEIIGQSIADHLAGVGSPYSV